MKIKIDLLFSQLLSVRNKFLFKGIQAIDFQLIENLN
jgi:hypothetical protein